MQRSGVYTLYVPAPTHHHHPTHTSPGARLLVGGHMLELRAHTPPSLPSPPPTHITRCVPACRRSRGGAAHMRPAAAAGLRGPCWEGSRHPAAAQSAWVGVGRGGVVCTERPLLGRKSASSSSTICVGKRRAWLVQVRGAPNTRILLLPPREDTHPPAPPPPHTSVPASCRARLRS